LAVLFTVGQYTEGEIRSQIGTQWLEGGREMVGLMFGAIGLLIVVVLSVLEARAEEALWSKCRGEESRRRAQQRISLGKSRIR
jgi:hypothetical protein